MAGNGMFIAIEGGEGSGKSTQIARLKAFVTQQYPVRKFVFTREPGGSPLAEEVRTIMTSDISKDASARTMLSLIMASRSDHVEKTIEPVLRGGDAVISDRFLASSYAYQVFGQEGEELEEVFWAYARTFLVPTLYLFLDVDSQVASERARNRADGSHFHARPTDFHTRVRAGYQAYFDTAVVPYLKIDAGQGIEEVWRDVQKAVESVLN